MPVNRRKTLSLKQKFEIIKLLDQGTLQATLARNWKVSPSVISRIAKNKENIAKAFGSRPKNVKKIRNSPHIELEKKLFDWFLLQNTRGIPISSSVLQEKADQIALELGINDFKCCSSWIWRFKKRHLMVQSTISGESASANKISAQQWLDEICPNLRNGYEDKDIFNGDETGLFYKLLSSKTLNIQGNRCVGGKLSRRE